MVLIVAGCFEVGWAVGMKYSAGFTRLWPSVWTVVSMVLSVGLLYWAVQRLPLGTAYAVWTGIGAAGTALLGIWLFHESTSPLRLLCILLVLLGVIGLKLTHVEPPASATAFPTEAGDPPGSSGH
jgi:quaternary ammonium compound-resistance protein SugE